MIPLWKGKNPIYFGVITIILFDNLYRRAYCKPTYIRGYYVSRFSDLRQFRGDLISR
jgi:hypothetical protein